MSPLYAESEDIAHDRFFADILLTPLEATRIRLVSDRNVCSPLFIHINAICTQADKQYANGLVSGFTKILSTEGIGSLYAGFIPILAKQVPYAIGQFTVNERCTEAIYKQMSPETKANLGPVQNLGITLGSGVVAGFAAAVLSHVNFDFFLPLFSFVILILLACRYTAIADQQGTWS